MSRPMDMKYLTGWVLAALLLLSGCAANPVTGEQDLVLMSEGQELALGRSNHGKILKEYGEYKDAELSAYVSRIGARVAEKSHRGNLLYRFTILDSPEVNAFALPGGYIYITRGLLALLDSEAELAAVLGHEVGHVTARHSVRQHSGQVVTGIIGAVIAAKSGVRGAGDLANVVGSAVVRGYGREHELEADRLGAEYLARTGYDPQAMLQVIRVLKAQEGFEKQRAKAEGREARSYHGLFATHPDNDTRLQQVVAAAEKHRSPTARRVDRDAFLRRLDGLAWGDSADQGVRRGREFFHADLDFYLKVPDGWRLENHPDRLEASPLNGEAILKITVTDRNRRITPEAFLRERLKLRDLRNGEAFTLRGLKGYTAVTTAGTSWGRRPVRVAVLYHGTRAFLFQGASKSTADPYRYDAQMIKTAQSFRSLTTAERRKVRSLRLKVRKVKDGEGFARLAADSPIADYQEQRLRLLNGRYPDGAPLRGLIKVVE